MKMADVPFLHLSLNSRSPSSKSFGTIVATERSKSFDCNRRDSDGAIWFAKRLAPVPIAIIDR